VSQRPPVGIFVVRAWHEDGQFRARVTRCDDVGDTETTETLTANTEVVVGQLNDWLTKLATPGQDGGRRDESP
jgi:hypothetical protein